MLSDKGRLHYISFGKLRQKSCNVMAAAAHMHSGDFLFVLEIKME